MRKGYASFLWPAKKGAMWSFVEISNYFSLGSITAWTSDINIWHIAVLPAGTAPSHSYISALALTCRKCLIGAEQTPTHPHTSPHPWAPTQAAPPPRCGCGMVSLHEWQPVNPAQQWLQQSDIEPVSLSRSLALFLTPPPLITAALQSHQLANIILSSGWC